MDDRTNAANNTKGNIYTGMTRLILVVEDLLHKLVSELDTQAIK